MGFLRWSKTCDRQIMARQSTSTPIPLMLRHLGSLFGLSIALAGPVIADDDVSLGVTAAPSAAQPVASANAPALDATAGYTAVPLASSGAGSFLVDVFVAGEATEFVLDTGAAMLTVNKTFYKTLKKQGLVEPAGEVAVRVADGRIKLVPVTRIERLDLGQGCEIRDVEAIVLSGKGRNLLGMNVLQRFAPLTLSMAPPSIQLSDCAPDLTVASTAS